MTEDIEYVLNGDPVISAKHDAWELCVLTARTNGLLDYEGVTLLMRAKPYLPPGPDAPMLIDGESS